MIDPTAIAAVYDFPFIFENALKAILTDLDIRAYTSQLVPQTGDPVQDAALVAAGYELLDYQRDRPRAEIEFISGAGAGIFREINVDGNPMEVETSRAGQYHVACITRADIRIHSAFVCSLRFYLQTLRIRINGITLQNHTLQPFAKDGGTSTKTEPEKGTFQTVLILDVNFSVLDDAWAQIET